MTLGAYKNCRHFYSERKEQTFLHLKIAGIFLLKDWRHFYSEKLPTTILTVKKRKKRMDFCYRKQTFWSTNQTSFSKYCKAVWVGKNQINTMEDGWLRLNKGSQMRDVKPARRMGTMDRKEGERESEERWRMGVGSVKEKYLTYFQLFGFLFVQSFNSDRKIYHQTENF